MAVLISDLQTLGDQLRRTDEAGTPNITAAKKLEAVALAVEDIHNQALFRFTQRVQRFDFLDGQSDYVMADNATNYEAAVRIPDFRAVKDLRMSDEHDDDFDYIDPNQFSLIFGKAQTDKVYTVEWRSGVPVLRVNRSDIGASTIVHLANDHDANGTWAVDSTNSDAINIGTDTIVYKANSGSIKFEADVSQSSNNRVTISVSDMTAVDLSGYQGTGIIRFWLYVPEVTDDTSIYVESVEFRWGSSSSNYWSQTVSRPANSGKFQDRWNLVEFNWRDATETGTVTETAINYLLVTVNYGSAQGDDTGFRINDIKIYNPKEMKLVYFSSNTIGSNTGVGVVFVPRATATTQQILAPDRYKNLYAFAYNYYIGLMSGGPDDKETLYWEQKYKGTYNPRTKKWVGGELEKMVREMGERIKIKQTKLRPQLSWD